MNILRFYSTLKSLCLHRSHPIHSFVMEQHILEPLTLDRTLIISKPRHHIFREEVSQSEIGALSESDQIKRPSVDISPQSNQELLVQITNMSEPRQRDIGMLGDDDFHLGMPFNSLFLIFMFDGLDIEELRTSVLMRDQNVIDFISVPILRLEAENSDRDVTKAKFGDGLRFRVLTVETGQGNGHQRSAKICSEDMGLIVERQNGHRSDGGPGFEHTVN